MNKDSGDNGIPVELFQILDNDVVKVRHSICQQIWKTQQWPQDWKRCFLCNPKGMKLQRMLKLPHSCTYFTCQQSNDQNSPSQISMVHELRISRCLNWILKRQRNQRSNYQHPLDHRKKTREFQKNICFIDQAKAFDCVNHNKLRKILKEVEIPDNFTRTCKTCMQVKKQQLELDMKQLFQNWERSTSRLYIVTLLM